MFGSTWPRPTWVCPFCSSCWPGQWATVPIQYSLIYLYNHRSLCFLLYTGCLKIIWKVENAYVRSERKVKILNQSLLKIGNIGNNRRYLQHLFKTETSRVIAAGLLASCHMHVLKHVIENLNNCFSRARLFKYLKEKTIQWRHVRKSHACIKTGRCILKSML